MNKVSVMMPAYNVEKYIGQAIESILNQSFQDFELLIVDDGSTDKTYELMQVYAQKSDKIRLLQNDQNRGLSYTRNRLLEEAQGEYLAILDSDDIALPDRLQKQVDFLDKNPNIGLLGGAVEYFGEQIVAKRMNVFLPPSLLACRLLFQNVFSQSSVMFRADLKKLKYDPTKPPAEDYHLWVRMSWQKEIFNLDEILVRYRIHGQNISTLKREILLKSVRTTYLEQLERIEISASEKEIALHESISKRALESDFETLKEAILWIEKLWQANRTNLVYEKEAFRNELCYHLNYVLSLFHTYGNKAYFFLKEKQILKEIILTTTYFKFLLLSKSKEENSAWQQIFQLYNRVR